jgi:putative transposase
MAKISTPSFVLEFPLATNLSDEARLNKGMFEAAKRLRNTLLQEGLEMVQAIRNDPAWDLTRKMPKADNAQRKSRGVEFSRIRKNHGFSDYDFQMRILTLRNNAGFSDRIGSAVVQKLATSVFRSLERYLLGLNGKPRFKGVKRPLHSIEGKTNKANLRWDSDTKELSLGRDWSIAGVMPNLAKDEWFWSALQSPVKFCRIVRRAVGHKNRFYLQLVLEGHAPIKTSILSRLAAPEARAGIDIGPSNIGWCSQTDAGFFKFCADVDAPQRLITNLQRKLDRQNRANNPENFDEKGRAKNGVKWVKSTNQRQTESRLRSVQAHTAEKRINAHGRDINMLLGKARSFRHDNVSVKSLQKNYGRSVGARAPGHFMSELERKAERAGGSSKSINVRQLKTSQFDHSTGEFRKKKLSERWHTFGDGRGRVQRDVYSAFLALHVVETVDADGVITEAHDREALEKAWQLLVPVLVAKGLFVQSENVNTCATQVEGDSSAPPYAPCQFVISEATEFIQAPGSQARGVVRMETFLKTKGLNLHGIRDAGAPLEIKNHRTSVR